MVLPATTNSRLLTGSKADISAPLALAMPPTLVKKLESLLVIVIFWEVAVPKEMPGDGVLIVKVAVSVPSTTASSATIKDIEPEVCPLGIVIVVLLR